MEKIEKGNPLSQSADIVTENIDLLKQLFPTIVKEGKIDLDELKALLDEEIETSEEYYRFSWAGKSDARRESNKPSTATLRPNKPDSKNWDTTGNIFIEGDNLEVLKLLQKSYAGEIKMMYFDPPYNTGKDFVYRDNYTDNLNNYLNLTSQTDEEGNKLSTNTESDGRYHSNWLNMMYPRLKLARNLLTDDGVVFISIGEQEVHNLRKICDEIFGETNFIGMAGRISKKANNQGDYWAPNFDYVLTYCKVREQCVPFFGGINYSSYDLIEEAGMRKGEKYQLVRLYMTSLDPMRGCNNQRYFIQCPDGSFVIPPGENFPERIEDGASITPQNGKDKVWRWSYKSYFENKDKIVVKKGRSSNLVNEKGEATLWNVYTKTYLQDVIDNSTATPNNFIEDHINQSSSHELKKLGIPFDFAKPSSLIAFLAQTCKAGKNDLVLDFFAGSGSTGQAIMNLNVEDFGNRKYILVQLPEKTEADSDEFKAGYKNIAEICKERLRRAGDQIIKEKKAKIVQLRKSIEGKMLQEEILEQINNLQLNINQLDIGFKAFKLDSSNIHAWDGSVDNFERNLLNAETNIKEGRTEEDVLFEILLKYGLDLTVPIEAKDVNTCKIYSIGKGVLFICLSDYITTEVATAIGKWKEELQPATCRALFKDNGFKDDIAKTNIIQILRQYGIEEANSI